MKPLSAAVVLASLVLAACDAPPPEPGKEPVGSKPSGSAAGTTVAPINVPPVAKGPFPESTHAAMKDPALATEQAPATFKMKFDTTAGAFEVECLRDWAPNGADRLYNLAKIGFFDDVGFFRVVKRPKPFVVQFGIHGNPAVAKAWVAANLPPDEVKEKNLRGTLTYAMAGSPDTRATQLFFNLSDNVNLDKMGFAPVCRVTGDGMSVVDALYAGYDGAPSEKQGQIQGQGNKFLRATYPLLDYIKTARLVGDDGPPADASASASASAAPSASAAASAKAGPAASGSAKAGPAKDKP